MTDHDVPVPDFVPVALQQAYRAQARQRVLASRRARQPARPHGRFTAACALTGHRPVVAAAVLGLLGLLALTSLWAWLAATRDPLWWWYATGGLALTVAFAGVQATLHRVCRPAGPRRGRPGAT